MRLLVIIFNHRTYPIAVSILFVGLIVALALNGFAVLDVGIVVAYAVLAYALWHLLVTTQTPEMDNLQAVEQQIRASDRPTVLEFYSSYCMGCMAMKPAVDRFEADEDKRLRIVRLNIDGEPGKTLMARHNVVFTPTFVTFDLQGNVLHQSVGILDRGGILQAIEGSA